MAPKKSSEKSVPRFPQTVFELNKRINQSYFSQHVSRPKSLNPNSLILGPNCPVDDIDLLTQYYPIRNDGEVMHQLSHLHWTNWEASKLHTCFRSWPSQKPMWADWVARMSPFMANTWERLGVAKMICLSTAEVNQDPPLIGAAAGFWSSSCNALLLNCGFVSPTILDVVQLTGFHSSGVEVYPFMSRPYGDETFSLSFPSSTGYQAFLSTFADLDSKAKPTKTELVAFYLYWLCSFVFCVPGVKPAKDYVTLALYLYHEQQLALAPAILGSLYRGLNLFVAKRVSNSTQGPMWLFQAWLKAYFPFSLGNHSAILSGEVISYAEFFLGHVHPEQSLISYFTNFYQIDRNGNSVNFDPFKENTYTPPHIIPFLPPVINHLSLTSNRFWSYLLLPRFLPTGNASKIFLEPYTPSQMARQFGFSQGVPMPFIHPTFREMSGDKCSLVISQKDALFRLLAEFENSRQAFKLLPFEKSFDYDSFFGDWWDIFVPVLFPSNLEDCWSRFQTKSTEEPIPIQGHLDIDGNYIKDSPAAPSRAPPASSRPSKGKRKLTESELLAQEGASKQRKKKDAPQAGEKLLAQSMRAATSPSVMTFQRRASRRQREEPPSKPEEDQLPVFEEEEEEEEEEIPLVRTRSRRPNFSPQASQAFTADEPALPKPAPITTISLSLASPKPLTQVPPNQGNDFVTSDGLQNPSSPILPSSNQSEDEAPSNLLLCLPAVEVTCASNPVGPASPQPTFQQLLPSENVGTATQVVAEFANDDDSEPGEVQSSARGLEAPSQFLVSKCVLRTTVWSQQKLSSNGM